MATFTDNLNRPNGGVGPNYVQGASGDSGLVIANNALRAVTDDTNYFGVLDREMEDNQSIAATMTVGSSAYSNALLVLRFDDVALNGYVLIFETSSGGTVRLARYDSGVSTTIGAPITGAGPGPYTMTFTATGSTLTVDVVGFGQIFSIVDATHSGGSVGVSLYRDGGAVPVIDDLVVTGVIESSPPEAVDDLAGTAGDEEVTLTWTAPDDGGAAITDYVVQYREVT